MKHVDMSEMLSAYANDEVSRTQREFVEEHLLNCPECRNGLAEFQQTRLQLASLKEISLVSTSGDITMTAIRARQLQRSSRIPRIARSVPVAGAIAALIVIALVIVFSNGDGKSAIARAYDAVADLESYRMIGTTIVVQNNQTLATNFDWTFDGDGRTKGTLSGPGGDIEFFIDGDVQYVRSQPGAGATAVVLGNSLLSPVPTREGTLRFLESLINVTELSTETVNGVQALHYSGDIDLGPEFDALLADVDPDSEEYRMTKAFSDIQRQSEITIELWISETDYRIQRLIIDARLASASSSNGVLVQGDWTTTRTVADYTEFNEPVDIAPPLTPSGQLEPGWLSTEDSGGDQSPPPEISLETR